MKVSTHFKNEIQTYLEQRAEYDELFARSYRNPLKNIEDCLTYILNYVKKSGCAGFSDDEIFGQAVHFYPKYIVIQSYSYTIFIIGNLHSIVFRIALDNIGFIPGSLLLKFPLFLGLFTTFAKNTINDTKYKDRLAKLFWH